MRYRPITRENIAQTPEWSALGRDLQEVIEAVSVVLPFRTNRYVMRELIDWSRVPADPVYQTTFPQRGMLAREDYALIAGMVKRRAPARLIRREANRIRYALNPHPDGQLTDNVPTLRGKRLRGLQHKYRETVLFFPSQGQTCHAYCTYCFRWPQFVGLPELRFANSESDRLVAYLKAHREVTDVILTGGDPMVMKAGVLRRYIEPLLAPELAHVQSIRIGTKAPAHWPARFVTSDDADELMRVFESIVSSGRNLALMAHYTHPAELSTPIAERAVRRIYSSGAVIRMQSPVIRHVNDTADTWRELWAKGVNLGCVPYYMFVGRDTGACRYFELPLADCLAIFRGAFTSVSGLARTVRGPSMSTHPGKVQVLGITNIGDERAFVLQFLQAREPERVGRPFFARFDPEATWYDQLEPFANQDREFFDHAGPRQLSIPSVAAS